LREFKTLIFLSKIHAQALMSLHTTLLALLIFHATSMGRCFSLQSAFDFRDAQNNSELRLFSAMTFCRFFSPCKIFRIFSLLRDENSPSLYLLLL
jgi:hypothetical protein